MSDSTRYYGTEQSESDPIWEKVREKVRGFTQLPEGWQYGEGQPVEGQVVTASLRLIDVAHTLGIEVDAFPGPEGDVAIVFYRGKMSLEVLAKTNGAYDVTLEDGIGYEYEVVQSLHNLRIRQVLQLVRDFGREEDTWNLHESFTPRIMILVASDIEVFASETTEGLSHSLTWSVSGG